MREYKYICDTCAEVIKIDHSGGKRPTWVPAVYYVPATIYTVTNNKGETFDYCSKECLEVAAQTAI